MSMNTFPWEDGTVVERPYVIIDGNKYYVQDGTYSGGTPASASNLNNMQDIINNNIVTQLYGRNEIVWRNTDPTISFPHQQIALDKSMNRASHYEILFKQSTQNERIMTTGKIPVGHGTILNWNTDVNHYRATSSTVSGQYITFEDNYSNGVITSTDTIPYQVILHYDNLW